MSVKPILFSGPMVRALLDGTKTQTRRVIKAQPPEIVTGAGRYGSSQAAGYWKNEWSWLSGDQTDIDAVSFEGDFKTPFHEGDFLWVRESWRVDARFDRVAPSDIKSQHPGTEYIATADPDDFDVMGKQRPSIHMPRWASRITLEVTDVRVERIQTMSEEDADAEGFRIPVRVCCGFEWCHNCPDLYPNSVSAFMYLWNSLNEKRGFGWNANPWVAAYTFTVHKQNVDELLKERAA